MLNICNLFQTIISATQSRKKQQTELVRSVLYAEKDKKRKERENLPITSLPVEMLAAQEPSLSSAVMEDQDEESDGELDRYVENTGSFIMTVWRERLIGTELKVPGDFLILKEKQGDTIKFWKDKL